MNRRTFLKLSSLSVGAAAVGLTIPFASAGAASTVVAFNGLTYRTDGGGRIVSSADGGLTWSLHSDLGVKVYRLQVTRRNQLKATMKFAGRKFGLVLAPDQKRWMTA
jgi:hypothetical protein